MMLLDRTTVYTEALKIMGLNEIDDNSDDKKKEEEEKKERNSRFLNNFKFDIDFFINKLAPLIKWNLSIIRDIEKNFIIDNNAENLNHKSSEEQSSILENILKFPNEIFSESFETSPKNKQKIESIINDIKNEEENNKKYDYLKKDSFGKDDFKNLIYLLIDINNLAITVLFTPLNYSYCSLDDTNWYKYHNIKNEVFLSYAYTDRLYAFCLFLFMLEHNILLYVDCIFSPCLSNGQHIETNLHKPLANSSQLLFLRSVNSELGIQSSTQPRSWCSWEIGAFSNMDKFDDHLKNRFYISMYGGKKVNKHQLLDGFKPLTDIRNGLLI